MRINLATLAAAAGLGLLATSMSLPAQAEWSDQVTTHRWDRKTENRQGSRGGWFEHRFGSTGGAITPRTFRENTTTHRHGTLTTTHAHGMLTARVPISMRSQSIVYTPRTQIQIPLKR
jgi:hypothetical protein